MDRWTAGETSDDLVSDLRTFAADANEPDDRRAWSALRAGEILTGHGQFDAARPDLEAAITLARSAGQLDPEVYARDLLILRQVAGDDFAAASTMCGRTIERIEEVRDQISTPYLESGFMQQRSPSYLMGVEMARRCSDWQVMLERIELLKARALQGPAPKQDTHAPLLAELRQLSREAASPPGRDDLRLRRRVLWERLLVEGERSRPRFVLAALQKLIAGRAVVLTYFFLAEDTLLRACISHRSVVCDKLALDGRHEFFGSLDRLGQAASGSRSVESDLAAVAPVLLPQSFAAEVEAAAQVIVCPHQSLHQVPFAALPFCGTTLIEHKPVGVVPNLTCLLNQSPQTGSSTAYFWGCPRAHRAMPKADRWRSWPAQSVRCATLRTLRNTEERAPGTRSDSGSHRLSTDTSSARACSRCAPRPARQRRGRQGHRRRADGGPARSLEGPSTASNIIILATRRRRRRLVGLPCGEAGDLGSRARAPSRRHGLRARGRVHQAGARARDLDRAAVRLPIRSRQK